MNAPLLRGRVVARPVPPAAAPAIRAACPDCGRRIVAPATPAALPCRCGGAYSARWSTGGRGGGPARMRPAGGEVRP